jgi:hypothetical protein
MHPSGFSDRKAFLAADRRENMASGDDKADRLVYVPARFGFCARRPKQRMANPLLPVSGKT